MSDRFDILRRLIVENKFTHLAEIGVFRCERSELMIKAALQHSAPEKIFFNGFDMFEDMTPELTKKEVSRPSGPWSKGTCEKYLEEKFPKVAVRLEKGDTKKMLAWPTVLAFEIIFIDGGHSLETAMSDWKNIERMMRPGAVAVFDDYSNISTMINTKKVVDSIDREKFTVEISEECDYATSDYENADLHLAIVRMK